MARIDMDKSGRSLKAEWSPRMPGSPAKLIVDFARREPMVVAAVVLFLAFAATSPVFGSLGNAENILRRPRSVLLLGLGMTFVVLVGGIDLSVGSVGDRRRRRSPASCSSPACRLGVAMLAARRASAPASASINALAHRGAPHQPGDRHPRHA